MPRSTELPDSDEIFSRGFIKGNIPLAETLALVGDSFFCLQIKKAMMERPAGFANIKAHVIFKLCGRV